ncbi:MAG: hypothetical protein ACXABH_13755, partial [Candidatus Thorarchaeota archaeon]
MKVESFEVYNPKAIMRFKLRTRLTDSFSRTNQILGYVNELNPDVLDEYIEAYQKRLEIVVENTAIRINSDGFLDLFKD